jgi:hypothetical protein
VRAGEVTEEISLEQDNSLGEIGKLLKYIPDKKGREIVLTAYNKAIEFMQEDHSFDKETNEEIIAKIQARYDPPDCLDEDGSSLYIRSLKVKGAQKDSYRYAVDTDQGLLQRDYHYRNRPVEHKDKGKFPYPYDSDTEHGDTMPAHLSEIDRFILHDISTKTGTPVQIQQCNSDRVTNSNLVEVALHLQQAIVSGYPKGKQTSFMKENDSLELEEGVLLTALLGTQLNRSTILLAKRSGMKITSAKLNHINNVGERPFIVEQKLFLEREEISADG